MDNRSKEYERQKNVVLEKINVHRAELQMKTKENNKSNVSGTMLLKGLTRGKQIFSILNRVHPLVLKAIQKSPKSSLGIVVMLLGIFGYFSTTLLGFFKEGDQ